MPWDSFPTYEFLLLPFPPVLVVWAKYGIGGAILKGIFFIIINTIAKATFSKLTGKGLQMSAFVVFVSLFVWGWILGPTGFLIGEPLTLIVIKYLENFEDTRWLDLMMTGEEEYNKAQEESKTH